MSKKGGLKKWFSEKWVDISAPKKGGGYKECGRKSASKSKRGYPKCVPAAKAARMTKGENDPLSQGNDQPQILALVLQMLRHLPKNIMVV